MSKRIKLTYERLDEIGYDIIQEYLKAKEQPYIKKPVAYALYQVWKKYDEMESEE